MAARWRMHSVRQIGPSQVESTCGVDLEQRNVDPDASKLGCIRGAAQLQRALAAEPFLHLRIQP